MANGSRYPVGFYDKKADKFVSFQVTGKRAAARAAKGPKRKLSDYNLFFQRLAPTFYKRGHTPEQVARMVSQAWHRNKSAMSQSDLLPSERREGGLPFSKAQVAKWKKSESKGKRTTSKGKGKGKAASAPKSSPARRRDPATGHYLPSKGKASTSKAKSTSKASTSKAKSTSKGKARRRDPRTGHFLPSRR